MKVCHVDEMRRLDKTASEKFGITEQLLMENAGLASYFAIYKELKDIKKKFIICCGIGNNGGDGFVVARKLHSNGADVKVFILGDPSKYKGAAKTNLEIINRLSIESMHVSSLSQIKHDISHCDVIIDAIFGTGLSRDIGGIYKDVIELINKSNAVVVSLDIPSGVSGNTGKIMGCAIKADFTITFGLPKLGNILYPGYEMGGKLYISHISFPPYLYEDDNITCQINEPLLMPIRQKTGHKGSFGDVLFIAGAKNYFGAPYLASYSFLKAGGGYSRLAAPKSITPFIASLSPEVVLIPQEETSDGSISLKNIEKLFQISEKVDMVIIGPGLSLNNETQQVILTLIEKIKKPILVDGDGITAVSKNMDVIKNRDSETILTPHLGEMSRITGISISELNDNKLQILQNICKEFKVITVLKGAHSLIGLPNKKVFINMTGNSGMATAGSGDVLTGTIAAMFGQGFSIIDAVKMGVFLHGLSGDLASYEKGEDGITAQDILNFLPKAIKLYRENSIHDRIKINYYEII